MKANKLNKVLVAVLLMAFLVGMSNTGVVIGKTKVGISKSSVTIFRGATKNLSFVGEKGKITWSVADDTIAKVSSSGKVTGIGKGKTIVKATVGKKSYQCKIRVRNPYINQKAKTVIVGDTYQILLTGAAMKDCTSSDEKVATVTSMGSVTALASGTCVIQVMDPYSNYYPLNLTVRNVNEWNQKTVTVSFMGNSLLGSGSIPIYTQDEGTIFGQKIKLEDSIHNGYSLSDFVKEVQANEETPIRALKNADYMVFQEYGTHYDTTVEDIATLRKYCPANTKCYYYMTSFDYFSNEYTIDLPGNGYLEKLMKEGITIIPAQKVISNLCNKGYSEEDFRIKGDYHPNALYGFISSMTTYATMFNEKMVDAPTGQIQPYFYSLLKGTTKEEKMANYYEICQVVDDTVANYMTEIQKEKNKDEINEVLDIMEYKIGELAYLVIKH